METYSQFQEDLIIWSFFKKKTDGVFLEIGANEPKTLSQTYLLEKNGWNGVLIEPMPGLATKLRKERSAQVFEVAVSSSDNEGKAYLVLDGAESFIQPEKPKGNHTEITVTTIDKVLEKARIKEIDFLSIDIEGEELPALQNFNIKKYKPKLILIEDHCENLKKHRYLQAQDYHLVNRIGCNNWYVPKGDRVSFTKQVSRYQLIRKLYLGMPTRKARLFLRKFKFSRHYRD